MRYPNIEALGVKTQSNGMYDYVSADDLERVLAEAPVVYGQLSVQDHVWNTKHPEWHDTHTAKLLCVQSIAKPDTAESLLREFVDWLKFVNEQGTTRDLVDRARTLLDGK